MSAPLAVLPTSPLLASVGGDPGASRTVYAAVIVLILIGIALVGLALWLYRSTRVDLSLLAPLETMSDRKWRRLDPASQRRLLDEERPEGARPLHVAPSAPDVDDEFESGVHAADGFDDLTEREPAAESPLDETAPFDRDSGEPAGADTAGNDPVRNAGTAAAAEDDDGAAGAGDRADDDGAGDADDQVDDDEALADETPRNSLDGRTRSAAHPDLGTPRSTVGSAVRQVVSGRGRTRPRRNAPTLP